MNYIRSGTFKNGTATNIDQGVSASVAGLDASLVTYTGTEGDSAINGTARSEVFAYYLKVGSNAGYRFDGVLEFNAGGGNDLVDLTNSANPYLHAVTIDGGTGNDTIWAGPGDDEIYGGPDSDSIWGGAGNDYLAGGEYDGEGISDDAPDTLYGGAGDDRLIGSSDDVVVGGADNDLLEIRVNSEDGTLQGMIDGGAGADELHLLGDLALTGFPTAPITGIELIRTSYTILAANPDEAVTFDFSQIGFDYAYGPEVSGSEAGDTIIGPPRVGNPFGFFHVYGNGGNDTIEAGNGDTVIEGNEGNDDITGGAGNDNIQGNGGADTIRGGVGDDYISGAGPADYEDDGVPDQLYGGPDDDWFTFGGNFGDGETIHDFEQGNDTIGLYGYSYDGDALNFNLIQSLGLIRQFVAGYVQINLTAVGGSNLLVNGTVAEFGASDFDFGLT